MPHVIYNFFVLSNLKHTRFKFTSRPRGVPEKKWYHFVGVDKGRNNSDAESTASGIGSPTGRTGGKDSDPRGNDYRAEEWDNCPKWKSRYMYNTLVFNLLGFFPKVFTLGIFIIAVKNIF